jgi:acetate kinase
VAVRSLVLVVNPGSASRKYALFTGSQNLATIRFEFVDNRIISEIDYSDQEQTKNYDNTDLDTVSNYVMPMLREYKIIEPDEKITAIGIRLVAPSQTFAHDVLATKDIEKTLKAIERWAPLHIKIVLREIKQLKSHLPKIPIVIVSDSAFHNTKSDMAWHYGIDTKLAEQLDIRRYGFHGISVESIIGQLKQSKMLLPKAIICHLGSGSSVTAIKDGKTLDTTMGYTPNEGVMMATRSGDIDMSAALMIKHKLKLTDEELEQYLNRRCGLLGVSGTSSDIRQLLVSEKRGDKRAKLALDMLVYRIQKAIGQMAASLDGVDCLVFAGTVGERSSVIRSRIISKLDYLGFKCDSAINDKVYEPTTAVNIATASSKPILAVSTNEAGEIAYRAEQYIKDNFAG